MHAAVHAALSQQQPHPLPTAARTSVGGGGLVCVPLSVSVCGELAAKLQYMPCKPGTPPSPLMWRVHRGPNERGEVGDGLQLSPTEEAINNTQGAEGQGVLPGRGSDSGHAPQTRPPTTRRTHTCSCKGKHGQQFARGDLRVRTRTGLSGTWRSLPRPRTKQATHAPCTLARHTGHPRPLQPCGATQRRPHRARPVTAVVATIPSDAARQGSAAGHGGA
jgi:hypothetical protein